jgi:protoporphyrinogen/coproporphyrinogen III oxidase
MGRLAEAAAAASRADVRVGFAVEEIVPLGQAGWELATSIGTITADGVILAVPAFVAAPLLRPLAPAAAGLLGEVDYASVAMILLAFDPGDIGRHLDASGFLVPSREGLLITACSWATSKWSHLGGSPVLLRVSAGRHGDERALDLDDDTLVASVVDELGRTMAVSGPPLEAHVARWPRSFPQYAPGHLDRVAAVEDELAQGWPTLRVTGAGHRGLGIPACIRQGREAAIRVLASLQA